MENKKPLVLISNDDGYHANGIKTLVNFLKDWCDLLVVAPESARSGFACAFSATTPLRLKRRHNMGNDVEVWSCSGTPVDCVKLALDQFLADRKPDLIIGGINHGDNSSVNNHYSGTMGVLRILFLRYFLSEFPQKTFENGAQDAVQLVGDPVVTRAYDLCHFGDVVELVADVLNGRTYRNQIDDQGDQGENTAQNQRSPDHRAGQLCEPDDEGP